MPTVRLFGVGGPKTGTHSLAAIFGPPVLSAHEPGAIDLIRTVLGWNQVQPPQKERDQYLRAREKRLHLHLDSSFLNVFILEDLLRLFRKAKFLLTIRDCYSCLDSYLNHSLVRPGRSEWVMLREFRFRRVEFPHSEKENLLKELGLFSLDSYLFSWAAHNRRILEAVPTDQLLVMRTTDLSTSMEMIADFAGFPRSAILWNNHHSYKNDRKFGILQKLDRTFLEAKVRQHCGDLMTQFFPEIRTFDDAQIPACSGESPPSGEAN